MTQSEYRSARETLGWTHSRMGKVLGLGPRSPYRYAAGDVDIPEPTARLVRLLVFLRLTISQRKFEQIIEQIVEQLY